jgi:hypothetical protein
MSDAVKTVVRPAVVAGDVLVAPQPMSVPALIVVRCTRVYLQTILGLLSAGGLGMVPGWTAGELVANVTQAATLSLAPVVFTFIQNSLELLARIDESAPRWRA